MSEENGRATLEIRDLRAEVEGKEILKGIDLTVAPGGDPRADGSQRIRQVDAVATSSWAGPATW